MPTFDTRLVGVILTFAQRITDLHQAITRLFDIAFADILAQPHQFFLGPPLVQQEKDRGAYRDLLRVAGTDANQ